jgi:hypothetical protein
LGELRNIFGFLFHSRLGKFLPVLIVAALIASASAAVFVMYYGAATATVRNPDVSLVAGPDASASCSDYPCATVSVSSNSFATVGISLFASATNSPQPSTYFTNLLQVHNSGSTASHTINSISISNIAQSGSDFGSISVYYCSTQTNSPETSSNCASLTFTSTSGGGSLSGNNILPQTLTAGSTGYIEIVGYAATTASAGDTVTFQIAMSWE